MEQHCWDVEGCTGGVRKRGSNTAVKWGCLGRSKPGERHRCEAQLSCTGGTYPCAKEHGETGPLSESLLRVCQAEVRERLR